MHKLIRVEAEVLRGAYTMSSRDRERCNGEHVVCRDVAAAVMIVLGENVRDARASGAYKRKWKKGCIRDR